MLSLCSLSLIDWSELILNLLREHGFTHIFIAPGARSTPLARAALGQTYYVLHFDERSLAFAAVGVGKTRIHKAVVIVTSGTAVGNLLPAVMEASLSLTSLILLTADRPYELREASANQTLDQVKLFTNFTRWEFDLPPPHDGLASNWLASIIAYAAWKASNGPVHLNCMFREPFISYPLVIPSLHPKYVTGEIIINYQPTWCEKGLFMVAEYMDEECFQLLIQLAQKLQWPILVEIGCSPRYHFMHNVVIPYHELIQWPPVDMMVQFGERLISKIPSTKEYILLSQSPFRIDASFTVTTRIVANAKMLLKSWLIHPNLTQPNHWLHLWQHLNWCVTYRLRKYFAREFHLSEPGVIRVCFQNAKPIMFVGNSMPIRDANRFVECCVHDYYPVHVFSNRGVSGIDGNLATSMGIIYALKKPLMCLLGDLAFLHDLNSLHLLRNYDVSIVILNNNGGGIFSFLPNMVMPICTCSHDYVNFFHIAKQFHFQYYEVTTWYELILCLKNARGAKIIEIHTNRDENFKLHKQINQFIHK
nr:2-succinyl-6-hydroxy-2,4-cyclohexadiene-1-carboxylate synthase [Cyanidioschyzonaceae sp. 1]